MKVESSVALLDGGSPIFPNVPLNAKLYAVALARDCSINPMRLKLVNLNQMVVPTSVGSASQTNTPSSSRRNTEPMLCVVFGEPKTPRLRRVATTAVPPDVYAPFPVLPFKVKLLASTRVMAHVPFAAVFPPTPAITIVSPEPKPWFATVILIGLALLAAVMDAGEPCAPRS